MTVFRWVHFTDLHAGHSRLKDEWSNLKAALHKDLNNLITRRGPWDFILFSGDLVNTGKPSEFSLVSEWLNDFFSEFARHDCRRIFLTFPGNHDLIRPKKVKDSTLQGLIRLWDNESAGVRDSFFDDNNGPSRNLITKAFRPYETWRRSLKDYQPREFSTGLLPGDFSTTIVKGEDQIGIVGLNSSFLQLTAGEYKARVAVDVRQFNHVCDGDGPKWVAERSVCLLMTHHPPHWMSPRATTQIETRINPPGRFALHLFGHLHAPDFTNISQGASEPRLRLQGRSLFGLENWGEESPEPRSFGYSLCELTLGSPRSATVRVWPRMLYDDTDPRFIHDHRLKLEEDDSGTAPFKVPCQPLRKLSPPVKKPQRRNRKTPQFVMPDMSRIRHDQFWMGTEIDEHREHQLDIRISKRFEGPRARISIEHDFYVSTYPITFEQWDCFVDECNQQTLLFDKIRGRCRVKGVNVGLAPWKPDDHSWGRGRIPVVNVSWHDAKVYLEWLTEKTGREYRLLTEAEWEYCCRSGTETDYWFGNELDETKANYGGHYLRPLEVGVLYRANSFGLWDMSGQVWEWVDDPWHPNHYGRPGDGGMWATHAFPDLHTVRGGSWKGSAGSVRSASRSFQIAEHRVDNIGFRIARDGD